MIKVVLVDVGSPRSELNEPLGIGNLAGILKTHFKKEVELKQFFLQINDIDICNFLKEYKADIIGISSKIGNLQTTEEIINCCLNLEKSPIIVIGDILATIHYDYILTKYKNIVCVLGEGEDSILGIVELINKSNDVSNTELIQNLIKNDVSNLALYNKNSIVKTTPNFVDLSIDFYPCRQFLSDLIDKYGIIRIEGSRGCPWNKCTFCYLKTKYNGEKWRPFNINKIINELIELSKYDVQMVYFNDEDFIGNNPKRAEHIAELIIENKRKGLIKKDLFFFISTSVRSVLHAYSCITKVKSMLIKMVDAGFSEIFLGIESGSKEQLKRYNKGATVTENKLAISLLKELNADIDIGFIMFDHQMTLNDLDENLTFIKEADLISNSSNMMKTMRVVPMTTLADNLISQNLIKASVDINTIEFIVEFQDERVKLIHRYFALWQKEVKQKAYKLQADARGQVSTDFTREELRLKLGKIREANYFYLRACVDSAKEINTKVELESKLNVLHVRYVKEWHQKF